MDNKELEKGLVKKLNRQEFLGELRNKLFGLKPEDIEDRISYYKEIIDDQMAGGMSEESAVAALGEVDDIVGRIMSEYSLTELVKDKVRPKKKVKAWLIVLLLLGFPVWFPVIVSLLAVFFTLYLVVWVIILCFYVADFTFAAIALAGILFTVRYWSVGELAGSFIFTGASLIAAGFTILWFLGCLGMTRGVAKFTGKMFLGLKTSFVGKEKAGVS